MFLYFYFVPCASSSSEIQYKNLDDHGIDIWLGTHWHRFKRERRPKKTRVVLSSARDKDLGKDHVSKTYTSHFGTITVFNEENEFMHLSGMIHEPHGDHYMLDNHTKMSAREVLAAAAKKQKKDTRVGFW